MHDFLSRIVAFLLNCYAATKNQLIMTWQQAEFCPKMFNLLGKCEQMIKYCNIKLKKMCHLLFSVDPFSKKDWYDVKAPSNFQIRNIGKTVVTRTQGTSKNLWY